MLVNNFHVSLRHTDKIPVNATVHELPKDNGGFKEFRVADYYCPDEWAKDGVFVEANEGDPLWFDFRRPDDYSAINWDCALLCSVQKVNPLTGQRVDPELTQNPIQNYLRLPEQLWLDGYVNEGKVYQFIITKSGIGVAVNEFVLPQFEQDSHCLAFAFHKAKKPADLPQRQPYVSSGYLSLSSSPKWFSPIHTPENWRIRARGMLITDSDTHSKGRWTQNRVAAKSFSGSQEVATKGSPVASNFLADEATLDTIESELISELITTESYEECDKASMAPGGRIEQLVIPDANLVSYYEEQPVNILKIYLALPEMFKKIMSNGKRQDSQKQDKYIHSGKIGDTQVPLAV